MAPLERAVLAIAVALPVARFLLDLSRGIDFLHYQYLVDDAFYYFTIARHIPYFNAGIPTTGFHPLYAFIASVFHTTLPPAHAIVACLSVLTAANAASVWLVHRIVRRLFAGPVALIAAAGWATSTKVYALSLTGVESILSVLLILVFFDRFLRLVQRKAFADAKAMTALGVWAGLTFWARMDAPVIVAPACAYALLAALRARQLRSAVLFCSAVLLLPLGWIFAMWVLTGSALPTSGVALRVMRWARPDSVPETGIALYAGYARAPLRYLAQYFGASLLPIGAAAAVAACSSGAAAYAIFRQVRRGGRESAPFVLLSGSLALGFAFWAAYYVFYQQGFRLWYGLYLAIPVYLVLVPASVDALRLAWPARRLAPAAATALVLLLAVFSTGGPNGLLLFDKYRGAVAANAYLADLPPGEKVGAFNAGAYNFYTEVDVINLDGVVNPEATEAHRRRDILGYMERIGVRYLIEQPDDNSFNWVRNLPEIELEKWVDLSAEYEPYPDADRPPSPVHLWKVRYRNEGAR